MVDWNKPIETRDGDPARVLATDIKGEYPVAVAVKSKDGSERVFKVHYDGTVVFPDPLIRNKKKKAVLNLYAQVGSYELRAVRHPNHDTAEAAKCDSITRENKKHYYVATVEVEI